MIRWALLGGVFLGFASGLAFEHRGHTPGPLAWFLGQSLAYQRDQLADAINRPDTGLNAKLSACHASEARSLAVLDSQNAAVGALAAAGARNAAATEKLQAAAERMAAKDRGVAAEIRAARPASADLCTSADQLILDYAGR